MVFNLLNMAKRPAEASTSGRTAKLPKASEITVEQGPRPTQNVRRLPANAPVDVCIYKYTDQASDLWELYKDEETPLYTELWKKTCFRFPPRVLITISGAIQKNNIETLERKDFTIKSLQVFLHKSVSDPDPTPRSAGYHLSDA